MGRAPCVTALLSALALWLSPLTARAQDEPPEVRADDPARARRLRSARERLRSEPTVQDVQREAVRYFRLEPDTIDSLRSRATSRALLPTISVGANLTRLDGNRHVDDPLAVLRTTDQFDNGSVGGSVTLAWDLAGTVFDPSQLQTYALVGYQVTILKEVTRLYFIRQQLLLSMLVDPPDDIQARVALELRIQEFTSLVDSYTGGYLSRRIERRRSRR